MTRARQEKIKKKSGGVDCDGPGCESDDGGKNITTRSKKKSFNQGKGQEGATAHPLHPLFDVVGNELLRGGGFGVSER